MDVFPQRREDVVPAVPVEPVSPAAPVEPAVEGGIGEEASSYGTEAPEAAAPEGQRSALGAWMGRIRAAILPEGVAATDESQWIVVGRWVLTAAFAIVPFVFLPVTAAPVELNKEFVFAMLVLAGLVCWLGDALATGEVRYRKSLLHWGIAGTTLVGAVAVFFSAAPVQSIANIGLSHETIIGIVALGLFAFLVTAVFRSADDVRRAYRWLITAGAVYGAFNLIQVTGTFLLPWEFAKNLNFAGAGSQNHLAIVFGILGVLLIGMLTRPAGEERRISAIGRIGYGLAGLIFFLNIAAVNLRWTWLGLAVAMAAVLAFRMGRANSEIKDQQSTIKHSDSDGPMFEMQRQSGELGEQRRAMPRGMALPMLVLALSVFLALFKIPLARPFVNLPVEVSPGYGVSLSVANRTLAERGPFGFLIGTGPGTFGYAYSRFKPQAINATAFWGVRFDQARSSLVNVISGQGYLGVLAWLGLMALFGLAAIRALYLAQRGEHPELALGAFGAIVFTWAVWFMYPLNLATLVVLFGLLGTFAFFERPKARWLGQTAAGGDEDGGRVDRTGYQLPGTSGVMPAETVRVADDTERRWDLYRSSHRTLGASFAIILVMIAGVAVGYLELQRYVSTVFYGFGIEKLGRERDPSRALADLVRAAQFWGSEPAYFRALSQAFLQQASGLISGFRPNESDAAATRTQLQTMIQNAIQSAQQAAALNRLDTQNWLTLGLAYENVLALVPGAEGQARTAYDAVSRLDPVNPLPKLFIARTAVSTADRIANQIQQLRGNRQAAEQVRAMENERTQLLSGAKQFLEEAIQLKPDFGPAHFLLVQVFDRQGDLTSAIDRAARLAQAVPNDAGIWFQLGFLLYKSNDRANAQAAFERAVGIDQNFSNARYFLGLIYDGNNDKERARAQFEKVQALNPDNDEVKRILTNLRAGQAALEGIAPPAPAPEARTEAPVEEKGEKRIEPPGRP